MSKNIKKQYPDIFIDWHPTLNGKTNPNNVKIKSRKQYWWRCTKRQCGCNWEDTIYARIYKKNGCPKCKERGIKRGIRDIFEIQKTLKEIKNASKGIDELLVIFLGEETNKKQRQISSVKISKKIFKINKLGIKFREDLLQHRKVNVKAKEYRKLRKENRKQPKKDEQPKIDASNI